MTGQFFFTLLNPAVAAILAGTFLVLWRKRPDQAYLALLAAAFACSGLAFAINDFARPFEAPANRIAANLLFMIAISAASISALLRINARPPLLYFATLIVLCTLAFCWFLFVMPSTLARVYLVNGFFMVIGGSTAWLLYRAMPRGTMDWFFVGLSVAVMLLAVARPLALAFNDLDINPGGSLGDSVYWATVQAFTPVLAISIALAFLIGLAMRLFDELRIEADRDYLTGLLNRRGFHKGLHKALTDDAVAAGVIIIDIDNFKRINDVFGHAAGDAVIADIGRILASHGHANLTARTGGEEFTLFYADCAPNDLLARADIVRSEVSLAHFDDLPADFQTTVSLGLHCRNPGESISDMLAAADHALYGAKRAGKDRAVFSGLAPRPADTGRKAS